MHRLRFILFVLLLLPGFGAAASGQTAASAVAVSAGAYHSCLLTSSGAVKCWGNNLDGELGDGSQVIQRRVPATVIGLASGVAAISAGGFHTCALTASGGVLCWGFGAYGELGDGTGTMSYSPVPVAGLASGVVAISAGSSHTCAITATSGLLCWGSNADGQLGDGTTTNRLTPVAVSGLSSGVVAVSAGANHTCALTAAGAVMCWGSITYGQLGGYPLDNSTPSTVLGLSDPIIALAAGLAHSCVATPGGVVRCWGNNDYGQLGNGTTYSQSSPAWGKAFSSAVTAVSAGGMHSCVIGDDGRPWCWGDDEYGQLGDGGASSLQTAPVAVAGLAGGVTAISAGYGHTCALTPTGGVRCWGNNQVGQLGDGSVAARATPIVVIGFAGLGPMATTTPATNLAAVSATLNGVVNPDGEATTAWFEYGLTSSFGATTASQNVGTATSDAAVSAAVTGLTCGTIYHFRAVASNTSGTRDGADMLLTTAPCAAQTGRAGVAAGDQHTCAVTAAGAAWCWGSNSYLGLGDGTTTSKSTPSPVSGLSSGVVAMAAGFGHSCVLTDAGAVFCWGYNTNGQGGDGTTTSNSTPSPVSGLSSGVVAIAAGAWHSCALTAAGGVFCWGYNLDGELGDGTTTTRLTPVAVSGLSSGVVAITAGLYHTCALTSDSMVWCWGHDTLGELGTGTSGGSQSTPVPVAGLLSGAVSISAAGTHTCAVATSGRAFCWGTSALGDGTTATRSRPAPVVGLSDAVVAVTTGNARTCALTAGGALSCWGAGGVGDGTSAQRLTAVAVTGLPSAVTTAAVGGGQLCAWLSDATLWCWGSNSQGQLGDGSTDNRLTPVAVVGFGSRSPVPGEVGASSVAPTSAVLEGTVNPNGLPTTAWFEYVKNGDLLKALPSVSVGDAMAPVPFSSPVGGLGCGTTYYARIVATNSTGTRTGNYWPFTTAACATPAATSIVPGVGSSLGGTLITITGSNFIAGMKVTLGGTNAWSLTVVSPTVLTALTPSHASGLVDVVVLSPDNQPATLAQAYRFKVMAAVDLGGTGRSTAAVFRGTTGEWWIWGQAGAIAFGQSGDIPVAADYNGDGTTELAVYRPSTAEWIVQGQAPAVFGQPGDVPAPGDYDGDGRAEMAVFRPKTGEWVIEGQESPTVWGMRGDIPAPADYNGEGVTELAVYRPTTGTWYVRGGQTVQWGMWGDVPVPADYNGDGKAEVAVYRPSTGWWYSFNGLRKQWGAPGDVPVPLDVNGDRVTEFVVFRPGSGTWYSVQPLTGVTAWWTWGQAGDTPVGQPPHLPPLPALKTSGDFDGDGAADLTVFRPSGGGWYTLQSTHAYREYVGVTLGRDGDIPVPGDYQGTGNQERAVYRPSTGQWLLEDGRTFTLGAPDDVPAAGDYDGDGVTDLAVFTPGTGVWSILTGASGFATLVTDTWGAAGDVPAPGDYDGDGKTDFAVFTPATGVWSIRSSLTGATLVSVPFGMTGDIPVPGDYDGDGKTDIAVYRPSTGDWYVLTSSSDWSNAQWYWWGAEGDIPVPGDFDGDGVTDVAVYRPSTGAWYVMDVMTIVGWGEAGDIPVLRRQ